MFVYELNAEALWHLMFAEQRYQIRNVLIIVMWDILIVNYIRKTVMCLGRQEIILNKRHDIWQAKSGFGESDVFALADELFCPQTANI